MNNNKILKRKSIRKKRWIPQPCFFCKHSMCICLNERDEDNYNQLTNVQSTNIRLTNIRLTNIRLTNIQLTNVRLTNIQSKHMNPNPRITRKRILKICSFCKSLTCNCLDERDEDEYYQSLGIESTIGSKQETLKSYWFCSTQ